MTQEDIQVSRIQENLRLSAVREGSKIVEAYFAAMNARDITAIGKTLHPELHFVGHTGETHGRESFLQTMGKVLDRLEKVDVTERFSLGGQSAYVYNMFFAHPLNPVRTASLMTHEDGAIKKIETIYDSKALENDLRRHGENKPTENPQTG